PHTVLNVKCTASTKPAQVDVQFSDSSGHGPSTTLAEQAPCDCEGVDAFVNDVKVSSASCSTLYGQKVGFDCVTFKVNWALTCTPGQGEGCRGTVVAHPPHAKTFGRKGSHSLRLVKVQCDGQCDETTNGRSKLLLTPFHVPLDGQTFNVKLVLFCLRNGAV